MGVLTLDFETAYGVHPETQEKITLTHMTNEEYVRHPLFHVFGVGLKHGAGASVWYAEDDILPALRSIDWENTVAVAHHAQFDGSILHWLYGIKPKFWLDTLSMTRAVYPWISASLASIAEHLGLKAKGDALVRTRNKWQLTPQELEELGDYCKDDLDITWEVFSRLKEHFPQSELRLIDLTVRMFTEPKIKIGRQVLLEEYRRELRAKRSFLVRSGTSRGVLLSNNKFAECLRELGVDPPTKISPRTGKETWAFAKTDEGLTLLQKHPKEEVRWLVEARLGVKSTIKETRTKRFYKIGTRGAFPVYLRYYGARSGRWSGGDRQNAQNLNRYDPSDKESGALRRSWVAPPGYVFGVADLSQIEARLLAYWAGQKDLLEVFRSGGDPYNFMASQLYGRPVDRKNNPEDKTPGMVGKAVVLGCGYSAGWRMFQEVMRVGFLGMPGVVFDKSYVDALGIDVTRVLKAREHRGNDARTLYEAALELRPKHVSLRDHLIHCAVTKTIIDRYRAANKKIIYLWREAGDALASVQAGTTVEIGNHSLATTIRDGIRLPNSMLVQYHRLKRSKEGWVYLSNKKSKEWSYIYGGKVVENVTQGVARIILSDQMLQIAKFARIVSMSHDEIITLLPVSEAAAQMDEIKKIMTAPATFAPGLPLACEGGINECYAFCEK